MPADGRTVKWTRDDGESFDVSAQWQTSQLTQTFNAEDGKRLNTFRLGANGALILEVTITSAQLPKPVKYSLNYRRSP
jgi:hypothetical protein